MNSVLAQIAAAGLLVLLGASLGTWAATRHFRPLLDEKQDKFAQCATARDNLSGLVAEQGKALGDLTRAASERQSRAEQAVTQAKDSAQADYAAANRLQQERTGGDQCAAATSIIDKELSL
ncbi:hypothetical protein QEM42_003112 [Pseudomonas putida]|nr:hypothetical protein [Pseudomonas putida]